MHGVVVGEHVGHFGERVVSVVAEEPVRAAGVNQIHEPVVVEVVHLGLQEEAAHFQAAACGDVGEVSRAIVFEELDGRAVVGGQTVEVTIVVDVCKVGGPALLVQHEATLKRFLCPPSIAVVHPKLVDATGIVGVVDKLTALGDEQVDVAIAVKVRPHGAVVATVVVAGVILQVVIRQIDEFRRRDQRPIFAALPHAAQRVVVAAKHVEHTVVVDVHPVARLHEHAAVGQIHARVHARRGDFLDKHPVVRPSRKHVLVAVVVEIRHAHAPLAGVADLAEVVIHEGSFRRLVECVKGVALIEHNQVVVSVAVQIGKADATAAVVGVGQKAVGIGERLGLDCAAHCGEREGPQSRARQCFHGFRFLVWSSRTLEALQGNTAYVGEVACVGET